MVSSGRTTAQAHRRWSGIQPGHELTGHLGIGTAVDLDGRIHHGHALGVDAARQTLQGRCVETGTHQQQRVVAGEEAPVILQHREAAALDPGICRVDVDQVHPAIAQGRIGQTVIEAGGCVEGKPIGAP